MIVDAASTILGLPERDGSRKVARVLRPDKINHALNRVSDRSALIQFFMPEILLLIGAVVYAAGGPHQPGPTSQPCCGLVALSGFQSARYRKSKAR